MKARFIILIILLIFFGLGTNAQEPFSCLSKHESKFGQYPKALLVSFEIDNAGEDREYSYIGGSFSYYIIVKNVGIEPIDTNIIVEVFNPQERYGNGLNTFPLNVAPKDTNAFHPRLEERDERKIFEFLILGTYSIKLSSKNIHFFRCVGESYIHYDGEISYAFDAMPAWQKQVILLQKEAISVQKDFLANIRDVKAAIQQINSGTIKFLSPENQLFTPFLITILGVVLAAILGSDLVRRALRALFWGIIICFSFWVILFFIGLIGITISFIPITPLISYDFAIILFVIGLGIFMIWAYSEIIWRIISRHIILHREKSKFKDNYFCLTCHNTIFIPNDDKLQCHRCNSKKIIKLELFTDKKLISIIYHKLKSIKAYILSS